MYNPGGRLNRRKDLDRSSRILSVASAIIMLTIHGTCLKHVLPRVVAFHHSPHIASRQRVTISAFLKQRNQSGTQKYLQRNGREVGRVPFSTSSMFASSSSSTTTATTTPPPPPPAAPLKVNLRTLPLDELTTLLRSWKQPGYRAKQIQHWIRERGVASFADMANLPRSLVALLERHGTLGDLELACEEVSRDGTIKRAYRLHDGQIIESVLMPYADGRNTACVSSQAGCAMGCVFCATGQMGFARQLTGDEIFEQVARFASELRADDRRLSNVVMMGMGEPLANYRNVLAAVGRMNTELGIGARKITVSTVGVVPNIRKLTHEPLQVRLAVSLHCATDAERDALLPANRRYGGLDELMTAVKDYTVVTKRRVTFEWALIERQNDTPEVARGLGRLLQRFDLRRDLCHVNLIPLNPTGGYAGAKPSNKQRVDAFVHVLEHEFGVSATPRVRRGIDIDAGCGQLKSKVKKREDALLGRSSSSTHGTDDQHQDVVPDPSLSGLEELQSFAKGVNNFASPPMVGVYDDDDDDDDDEEDDAEVLQDDLFDTVNSVDIPTLPLQQQHTVQSIDLDNEDHEFEDECYTSQEEMSEVDRIMSLVTSSLPTPVVLKIKSPKKEKKQGNGKNNNNNEQDRLLSLVTSSVPTPVAASSTKSPKKTKKQDVKGISVDDDDYAPMVVGATTTITSEDSVREAKRRRKKLLKNLKMITKLREKEAAGIHKLNEEQLVKVAKEGEWRAELESVEHNLQ